MCPNTSVTNEMIPNILLDVFNVYDDAILKISIFCFNYSNSN